MRTQEKLIYTNERGESIEFSPASSYHVNFKDVTGLSDVRNAIYSTNSMGQDGDTYLGYRIESRDIDIVGYIKERDKQAAQNLRRKLNRILNPQYEATLTYVFGDFRRVIGCKIDDAPIFKRKPIFEQFTVSLSCLNPFWREETETREDIATWIGGFEFPVPDGLELYDGWEIGYRQPSLIVNVYNSGDVKSGIRIEFRAIGAVTNPVLLNVDTREFIKLNISLVAGDVLTVSTGYGEKAVKLNRGGTITDAFRYLDVDSSYLQIAVGDISSVIQRTRTPKISKFRSITITCIWGCSAVELYVYSRDMTLQGIVEKISSLIWTRRYWSCGEFKLLVPFTEEHARLLVKENIIIKRGGNEAAEIRYIHITKNSQGMEEIEVQGKFLLSWIGKRILTTQIITKDTTQNILYAIVKQTCTNAGAARNIPNFSISTTDADTGSGQIDYTSEQYANAQLAAETAAKAAKLGIRVLTNARTGKHTFSVYEGRDLTAGNTAGNAPCIFSQEFDNIVEQEYTNSVENLKTTAYVGGEEKEGVTRKVAEVGGSSTGLSRDEVFINATDIVQEYENESGQTVTLTNAQYLALLSARGVEELEQYAETLAFGSKINTNANLKYGTDYDLGDRVTCINKRWNVRIDVRITEIAETYETSGEEIDITFGESLPALLTQIRQITK